MANNTNAQVVKFSDTQIRPLADLYAQLYYRCKAVAAAYTAQSMGTLIPNDANLIADTAVTGPDGRAPISDADINTFATSVTAFIADLEANSSTKLNTLMKIAVNPIR